MTLKSTCFNSAIAVTMVVGATLSQLPAHAVSMGDRLNFSWVGVIETNTPKIDFYNLDLTPGATTGEFNVLTGSTGVFAGLDKGTIKDLEVDDIVALASGAAGIVDWLNVGNPESNFTLQRVTGFDSGAATLSFEGVFGNGIAGTGSFQVLGTLGPAFSYQGSVVAVPTPALLPGLLGMGLAAWRKRKVAATVDDTTNQS